MDQFSRQDWDSRSSTGILISRDCDDRWIGDNHRRYWLRTPSNFDEQQPPTSAYRAVDLYRPTGAQTPAETVAPVDLHGYLPPCLNSHTSTVERISSHLPILLEKKFEHICPGPSRVLRSQDVGYGAQDFYTLSRPYPGRQSVIDKTTARKLPHTLMDDNQATSMVTQNFKRGRRYPSCQKHEHYLRGLIKRQNILDEKALDDILFTMDTVFFNRTLDGRVRWKWSSPSETRYETEFVGATALRPAAQGGFETLVTLSKPILQQSRYSRKLLLTAFLHELIHCYLFIHCGFKAKSEGGHTNGFRAIAETIDEWIGPGYLKLRHMEADLSEFLEDEAQIGRNHVVHFYTGRR